MKSRRTHFSAENVGPTRGHGAFTRVELCTCVAAGVLLGLLALPALATTQTRGEVAQCLNNLRLAGRAVEMFASDHVGQPSWRTYASDGGTRPVSITKAGAAWFEFAALSNELATPRILACPADMGVKVAAEFSNNGAGGYLNTGFRSQATSYFINLDPPPLAPASPPAWPVFGDRNVRFNGMESCALGLNNADRFTQTDGRWTNEVHGAWGAVVRADGGASETSTEQFRGLLRINNFDDANTRHFLRAR